MGTLFLVATPIGNLEDITLRAMRILRECNLIAAEDTRVTRKLLDRYEINTPLLSYHMHNHLARVDTILHTLETGDVALVSDAGTPGLNDPGVLLVQTVIEKGFPVSPIPGASAPISALITSGLGTDQFLYLGYLPRRKKDRLNLLISIRDLSYTLIFLEAPHRLLASLEDSLSTLGDRSMACARELTKVHEEILRGKISEIQAHFLLVQPRGEFTLVIAGVNATAPVIKDDQIIEEIHLGLKNQIPPGDLARSISALTGISRKDIYQKILSAQKVLKK